MMTPLPLFLLSSVLVLLPLPSTGDAIYGPSCNLSTTPASIYPCKSYALYRANTTDLDSVADLFDTSRLSIANASNISDTSQSLYPNQPLLIPLDCSCLNKNHSYALISYKFLAGDIFWDLARSTYANLTTSNASVLANPTLVPNNISVGAWAKIPIFCQCLTTNLGGNYSAIISYSVLPGDTLASIAKGFGIDVSSLAEVNDGVQTDPDPFSVIFVPLNSSLPIDLTSFEPKDRSAPAPTADNTEDSNNDNDNDNDGVVIGLGVAIGVLGFLLIFLVIIFWFSLRRKKRSVEDQEYVGPTTGSGEDRDNMSFKYNSTTSYQGLLAGIDGCLDKYRVFHISDLRKATKDFDSKYLITRSVYKGWLDGHPFAIKMVKWNGNEELPILQKVNHTNLVKLEGFSVNPEDGSCYMVYEYVENGSLQACMKSPTTKLDWRRRVNIGIDVASGLHYIHEHTFPTVIHKDINSENILLDHNLKAKIANFGLAKSGCNVMTTNIVGTQGYMSPEYLNGIVTTKMDVYAFGVVLLELISGREAVSEEGVVLSAEVDREFVGDDSVDIEKLRSWMDPRIRSEVDGLGMESVVMLMDIAKGCLQNDPGRRSGMTEVVYVLSKVDDVLSAVPAAANGN